MQITQNDGQSYIHPYGMLMDGRSYSSENYRFGFNGMEKNTEINSNGSSLDFGARIYDGRIGRFLSVDPLFFNYSWQSSYVFAANNPILYIDVLGMGPGDPIKGEKSVEKGDGPAEYGRKNKMQGSDLSICDKLAKLNPKNFKEYDLDNNWTNQQKSDYFNNTSGEKWSIHPGEKLFVGVEVGCDFNKEAYNKLKQNSSKPAAVTNIYKVVVYSADILGSGYSKMWFSAYEDKPTGFWESEASSSGWGLGSGLGTDANLSSALRGRVEIDKSWINKVNASTLAELTNSIKWQITTVGSIFHGGTIKGFDPKSMKQVASGYIYGGGIFAGVSSSFTMGGFINSPIRDSNSAARKNLKFGLGDTVAFKTYLQSK